MKLLKRIYHLLQAEERKKVLKMAVTVFCSALLDFVGLAVLLPVLYFLLDEGGRSEAAVFFCLLAMGVILVKCVLSTFFTRYQNQCLLGFYRRLSFSLFSSYYSRGLLFIREHGSNKLGYEINGMCYAFSHSLLAPICRMAGDVLLILLVTIALLVWNGATVLILFASFIPFMCFYFFGVRKRVRKYGADDMAVKREQARVVADTFRGYVELEVNGAFPTLQRSFLQGMDKISYNRQKLDMLLRLPLFLSELSVVVGLTMLVFFGQGDVRMLVGVFAVASFRLLPALRAILSGWTQIQNALCCLDVIEEGLKDYQEEITTEIQDISFQHEIRMEGISYAYPGGESILKDFHCSISKGEYVGFCGTSGVGKSTLFNLLIGLLEPDSGEMKIDGAPLTRTTRDSWMKQIGYVPQEVFIFNGTLAENIALGCEQIDHRRIEGILEQLGLCKWVKSLSDGVNTTLSEAGGKMSGGQKQRIGIARALYKKVSVLLLDEATSALDNATEKEINRILKQLKENHEGLTILSIAHRESSLSFCDRIITIE
ncbi:MAG: ABC transporter ATP-binding protein [Bacteroidaceae bacterium]|nr:ABC transporter ATP-binding protein [Bacteroidaceae bacterium]